MDSLSLTFSPNASAETLFTQSLETLTTEVKKVVASTKSIKPEVIRSNDNERFVTAILEGNSKGLNLIYRKFFALVRGYVLKAGGNAEDAQDIFQEGIMVVYKKVQQEDFSLSCAFGTYLFGVCKYLWLNQRKKKSRTETSLDGFFQVEDPDNLEEVMHQRAQHTLFRKKFEQLNEDERMVMRLYLEGFSMKEIAETMGYKSDLYARKKKCMIQKKLVDLIKSDRTFNELAVK